MATLQENATAVKTAQEAIDAAIRAKGATTAGGLNNAAAAIATIQTGAQVEALSVTENGTYTAQAGHGYTPVTVAVPAAGAPTNSCIVNVRVNPSGSSYEIPASEEDKAVLLSGAKVLISVAGFANPLEVALTSLEAFVARVIVPASDTPLAGTVAVHLGSSETVAYMASSNSFTAQAGAERTVTLTTAQATGTLVELARCQAWNNTAAGDGDSFLMTQITTGSGAVRHVGYYDALNQFHNECKTDISVWKCPKDANGNPDPSNNEKIVVIDGGENSVDIMQRLACLRSITMADVTFTGDSASLANNKFVRFTGPLYVKTTMENVAIPVKDANGDVVSSQNVYCCVKWYCCDFASDAAATAAGYHRHPFFCRYVRNGNAYTETPTTYGYIARYPIKSNNLVCGGATYALACSQSDNSNEISNTRYGFLDWCRAVNKATITIAVSGEANKVIAANSDSRCASMFELRELSFMQHMAYLFFGCDTQSVLKGICSTTGDAQAQQANGKTDYILSQGIWNGGEDPSLLYKQIVFLGVEGAIWSAPGMMYPNFTSICERITTTNDAGTPTSTTRNRYIFSTDRADFNPESIDETALMTAGYQDIGFDVASGNTRQGVSSALVMRDCFLPIADKTVANINVASKDNHWQGGFPAAIANYAAATAYSVNALVVYSNKVYRCNEACTGETPGVSAKWDLVTNETIKAQNYYMVALGNARGNGSSLGAFYVNATNGRSTSYGAGWRSRLSLQEVS